MQDAGLEPADIDGVACAGASPAAIAHYLGITPTYVDGTAVGGCSFMLHVRHAAAAIARRPVQHRARHPRRVRASRGVGRGGFGRRRRRRLQAQFEAPYGPMGPPTMFPMGVLRYMKTYGLTHEQLAMVAVVQREWAARTRAR